MTSFYFRIISSEDSKYHSASTSNTGSDIISSTTPSYTDKWVRIFFFRDRRVFSQLPYSLADWTWSDCVNVSPMIFDSFFLIWHRWQHIPLILLSIKALKTGIDKKELYFMPKIAKFISYPHHGVLNSLTSHNQYVATKHCYCLRVD